MNEFNPIPHHNPIEGVDFNKLTVVFKSNLLWLVVILFMTNATAYLFIRYTKDVYESISEIKLDVKKEATEFGFRDFGQDHDLKLISGEIENIQSKLFLSQVIDSLNLHVSYYSIGQVLNFELYKSAPFEVAFKNTSSTLLNTSFFIKPLPNNQYELIIENTERTITGTFDVPLQLEGLTLMIRQRPGCTFDKGITYSFIINSRDMLLNYLRRNLAIEPLNLNANTIRVAFKDFNPIKAKELVDGIDSLYLRYSNEQKNRANRQKIEWLTSELRQIEAKMESYEDYFENFTLENKTSDLQEDLKTVIKQINAIDSQRYELTRRIQDSDDILRNISNESILTNIPRSRILSQAFQEKLEKLDLLTAELNRMKLSYNETTFAYQGKEGEIRQLRQTIVSELESYKKSAQRQLQTLSKAKDKLEQEFASMPDKSTQFSKNQRFYKLYEEFYLTLMQSKSEFEVAQAGSTPDFKILANATLPQAPISPNRPMVYGIGFVSGIMISLFLIAILYLANNKINSLNELERSTRTPVLGSIPALRKKTEEADIYVIDHPRSMVSEAIRTLRTNLDFFHTPSPQKIVAISSSVSGEGKSFIAKNLGAVIALSRKRVILLDLDMRKPKAEIANVDPTKGVSTILSGKDTWSDCVASTNLEGLHYIPAGPQPPNPAELLLNAEFHKLLTELKQRYDFIILDTPPIGLITDGIMAMKSADISIFVFRANYSKRDFINNFLRINSVNKFTNITTILNALPVSVDNYGYGYYAEDQESKSYKSLFKKRA